MTEESRATLQQRCAYLAAQLEQSSRDIARLDRFNLRLAAELKRLAAAFEIVKTLPSAAEKAATIEAAHQNMVDAFTGNLGMDAAAFLVLHEKERHLELQQSSGIDELPPLPPFPPSLDWQALLQPAAVNASSTPTEVHWYLRQALGFPYFIWYPFSHEEYNMALFVGNRWEDLVQRQPFTTTTLEAFEALVSLTRLRYGNIMRTSQMISIREQELQRRLEFEAAISRIAGRLLRANSLDQAVGECLSELSRLTGASSARLMLLPAPDAPTTEFLEWSNRGEAITRHRTKSVSGSHFPRWLDRMQAGETIHITDPTLLEATEQAELEQLGLQEWDNLLAVPLYLGEKLAGHIILGCFSETRDWRSDDLEILLLSARLLGGTIERFQAEQETRRSLQEKELLLKEIHHRVKNNLELIASLINLQASLGKDGDMQQVLPELEKRVRSMAVIHENLYPSQEEHSVQARPFLERLCEEVFFGYGAQEKQLHYSLEADAIYLPLDQAVYCGMIVHELFSNAIRHGFANRDKGEIRIGLTEEAPHQVRLSVCDNGAGLPKPNKTSGKNKLGLSLVEMLAQSQLKGSLKPIPDATWHGFEVRWNSAPD